MENLDDVAIGYVAAYFQVLSEPMRLRILNILRYSQRNVGELAESLDSTPANISKHLSLLAKGGFVIRETSGNSVYYRIADEGIFDLCNLVCGQVGKRLAEQGAMAAKLMSRR